jgi:hypothetical protein
MKKKFRKEVMAGFNKNLAGKPEFITEADLEHLPESVKRYLHYTGVVGKEKVHNMRVVMKGHIRSNPGEGWMSLRSVQYNFFNDNPVRIYFLTAFKAGLPVFGLHIYKNRKATFRVRLLGLFTLVDAAGSKLDRAETVTLFNDMCLMAPATLIDKNIKWEELDPFTVTAGYTNGNITITAKLIFNEKGELVNFISNDRFETNGKVYNNYPWLTPVRKYSDFNSIRIASDVSTDYQRPEVTFSYGEFILRDVKYNCPGLI